MAYENRVECHVTFDAVLSSTKNRTYSSIRWAIEYSSCGVSRGISGAGSLIPFDAFDRLSSLSTAL
jgi:hypothetical protein